MKYAYRILVSELKGSDHLGHLGGGDDNTMDLEEEIIGCVDCLDHSSGESPVVELSSFLGSTAQLRPWPPPQNPAEFRGGFSTIFFFTG
jgi:hypothetical protein